jgi:hypothetical protein
MNRRDFFKKCGLGLAGVAGVALLGKAKEELPPLRVVNFPQLRRSEIALAPHGNPPAWEEFLKQHPKINNNNPSGLYAESIYYRIYQKDESIKPTARFWLKQVKCLPDDTHTIRVYLVEEIDQYKFSLVEVYCDYPKMIRTALENSGWKFSELVADMIGEDVYEFIKV